MNKIDELRQGARKLNFSYDILYGEPAKAIINKVFNKFKPQRITGHLSIESEKSLKLDTNENEFSFSETLENTPIYIFFEQDEIHNEIIFVLHEGRKLSKLLNECYGMEYFVSNHNLDFLISVNWYVIEILYSQLKEKLSPYKTINGRDFTKEEWEAYEAEEYRKYIEKKNKKSFFAVEDKTPQNFSAETGRLQNVEYIVFNSRGEQVPVYQYPSTMVAPISFLDNGTAIQILKYEKDGWCEVLSKNQKKGYIQSSFVKKNS